MEVHTKPSTQLPDGLSFAEHALDDYTASLLPSKALQTLVHLHRSFNPKRLELLSLRRERQYAWDRGALPGYEDPNSEAVSGNWSVKPIPEDLQCRRVEITGPVNSAKMVINMLSRNDEGFRADMAMLDFEDSMKPSWQNVLDGLFCVKGSADRSLSYVKKGSKGQPDKTYSLDPDDMAGIMVRVRGLHLREDNILIDNEPVSGGLFDLWMSAVHMVHQQLKHGKTPKFYIPKCEHYLEARWWNELLNEVESHLQVETGTIRTTFLIETLPAAFQIEEILYELRSRAAGLNVGRWDKIFSDIKVLKNHPDRIMADRATINMHKYWMDNYAKRLIKICHSRGAFAIGGMSAFTPGKEPEVREAQTAKVFADKSNEAAIGHDGCWVSHPYFIGYALKAFEHKNQLNRTLDDFDKYPDLLPISEKPRTESGLRTNVRVGIGYMNGWNQDIGCVSWDNLMEDLATLEISRAQTWQWLYHEVELEDGEKVSKQLIKQIFEEELATIINEVREAYSGMGDTQLNVIIEGFRKASDDAYRVFTADELADFLSEAL
jgi:malate synthase